MAQLHWAASSPTGLIKVTFPDGGGHRMATGILSLVTGTKEPKTDPIEGGFAIRNSVIEACGKDTTTVWSAMTSANTSRLARYALPKKELALVHITHVDANKKEVAIANMWKLPTGCNIETFTKEIEETVKILHQSTHGIKRKKEDFDDTLQGLVTKTNKRVHKILGDKALPADPM